MMRVMRVCAITIVVASGIFGCVAEGPALQPRPQPRDVPEPAGMVPRTIVLTADQIPVDSDGNGYADSFRVILYLFGDRSRHELPIHAEGTFVFELITLEGDLLARWMMDGEMARASRFESLVGPGYGFSLNMLDVGSDQTANRMANLRAVFAPAVGDPIEARGSATIRIGRIGG